MIVFVNEMNTLGTSEGWRTHEECSDYAFAKTFSIHFFQYINPNPDYYLHDNIQFPSTCFMGKGIFLTTMMKQICLLNMFVTYPQLYFVSFIELPD